MLRDYYTAILLILFLAPGYTCAQSESDSLREKLKTTRGLQRAKLLLELSGYTRQTDVQTAKNQANEALGIAQRLADEKLEAKSQLKMGFYHLIQNKDAETLEYNLKALELARQHEYQATESSVMHELGRFYEGQENYSRTLEYYFKALRIRVAEADQRGAAQTFYYIGMVYDK